MKNYQFSDEQIMKMLNIIAKEPYIEVFQLMDVIKGQFNQQVEQEQQNNGVIDFGNGESV